jgi:Immunity protein 72/Immunity protein 71
VGLGQLEQLYNELVSREIVMGILDFLKTKWSAGEMTEEDRKKIFWYLKLKTSYTAWKREADAFDRFADIYEKQVREEPHVPGYMEGTDWEPFFPEILKGQVLYEKALARLKTGDRSVWLYNELGLMGDALTIASSWHVKMVNDEQYAHGKDMGHSLGGKYVLDMVKAMEEWFTCASSTGYLQPWFEDIGTPDTYYKEKFDAYPDIGREAVIFPPYLPDVPEPEVEVLVRTGEEVPVFGIYEPQIKDGCMNYLHGGTKARPYDMAQQRPVAWRLIWEDDRYLDGHIPSEEELYFPPQAKAKAPDTPVTSNLISASTGQICPKSGNWAVMNDLQGKATLSKGDKMPHHQGRDVVWVWGS